MGSYFSLLLIARSIASVRITEIARGNPRSLNRGQGKYVIRVECCLGCLCKSFLAGLLPAPATTLIPACSKGKRIQRSFAGELAVKASNRRPSDGQLGKTHHRPAAEHGTLNFALLPSPAFVFLLGEQKQPFCEHCFCYGLSPGRQECFQCISDGL